MDLNQMMRAMMEAKEAKEAEGGDDKRNLLAEKARKKYLEVALKYNVQILYLVTDCGDFTNQFVNLDDLYRKQRYLIGRGIVKLALDMLSDAPESLLDAGEFAGEFLSAGDEFSVRPLYFVGRFGDSLRAVINVPSEMADNRLVARAGIQLLVEEFLNRNKASF